MKLTTCYLISDVVSMILNLKQIRFKKQIEDADSEEVNISITNQNIITAGDFGKFISNFQILPNYFGSFAYIRCICYCICSICHKFYLIIYTFFLNTP